MKESEIAAAIRVLANSVSTLGWLLYFAIIMHACSLMLHH